MTIWDEKKLENSTGADVAVFSKLMSEMYDQSWYGILGNDEIEFFLSWVQGKRTLEIGSGTGRITIPLLEQDIDIFGVEGAPGMLKKLHSKVNGDADTLRFILWNAMNTPYPADDCTFEMVIIPFSTYGLVHNNVENLGENRLLGEISRLLVPGGYLVINDWRVGEFDRSLVNKEQEPWVHEHSHPEHGTIIEEQCSFFKLNPNRILNQQIIRERKTTLTRKNDSKIMEQFQESIPIWDTLDFPLLGQDAGFEYVKCDHCHFHESPSVHHIFKKK